MPYASNVSLPPRLRALPAHAKTIFRTAYNNAWRQYARPARRKLGGSHEEVTNRVAWAAVKKVYRKVGDRWVKRGVK
ncbi:MAG TPA: ChaB family protein [Candidatus Nanoarchaeia archaeon]|nr:ChaB family protein [Candidatus Nanoarchaeia archaeon]